ncbi:MAG: acetolactate synthase large subunit [Clostridia bacterium]|jgi:acetolactate synthase-1/2/3 large subunit|nr:acetolactate synthase, large subunit, biosynthetic type [Clostridiales bacterium]MDK2985928.1 acetolactate synthase large subunit [Clostridia bacterium]
MAVAKDLREVCQFGNLMEVGKKMSGADILIKSLECEGVDTIFGYPGGAVLNIYDAIYRCKKIKHILTRHEQGLIHAADGYARSTGKPGVCIATSGPGATNLVTGIATAYMDSVPLVIITGQVAVSYIGKDSFQEADITGITLPITKYSYLVKDVRDLARYVREAFHLATTGRPGPVLIDLPKDVTYAETEFFYPPEIDLPGYKLKPNGIEKEVEKASEMLKEAQRPVIIAGGGVVNSGAHEELLALAEKLQIPVSTTLMGKGSFPENHPLYLGMPGMHGTAYANYAISDCDLLLAVGMRFDDRVTGNVKTFAKDAKVIHIDIDAAEINKNIHVDLSIVSDAKNALEKLLGLVNEKDNRRWLDKIEYWKKEYPLKYCKDSTRIKPQYILEKINEVTAGDAYFVTDTGQHQMWAAQYLKCVRPRSFMTSGGLGTMGYGFPAAMGVQIAHPEAKVVTIVGDGGFQMNSQELATAVHYNLPLTICIFNNGYLGMVRQWQDLFLDKRYSHTEISQPDFVKLAESYGAVGMRVEKPEDVKKTLEKAMETPRPVVIDFLIEQEENVFPMVPAGGSIDKMLGR